MLRASSDTVHRARKLRKEMSLPKILLWRELRQRPGGFKFRKQHPVGLFALDFFCSETKLAIEIDGQSHGHGDQPEFDEKRDAWLRLHDIETLRIPAAEILTDLEGALAHILHAARARPPLHRLRTVPLPVPGRNKEVT